MSTQNEPSRLLSGMTSFVTGASSGLGAHFARLLADAGANVVIGARRKDKLEGLGENLTGSSGKILAIEMDVNDTASIGCIFDEVEAHGLNVDILVNNAGVNVVAPALEMTPDGYDQILNTNTKAPFFMAAEAARRMIARQAPGRIINIASVAAMNVLPGATAYCMSKSAMSMMSRGLAREWARYMINVNAICPGYIETDINEFWWKTDGGKKQMASFPRRRLAQASDLDGALLMLAGPAGAGITGSSITVDDGQYI